MVNTKSPTVDRVQAIEPPDSHYLSAAEGWLGLNDWMSANRELDQVNPALCAHPAVLRLRVKVCAAAQQHVTAAALARVLTVVLPEDPLGWIHWAYSLYELHRTGEARDVLAAAVEKFPGDYLMRYSLACYSCQLGDLKESLQWLRKAVALAGEREVKEMVMDNPDLQPLWDEIGKM